MTLRIAVVTSQLPPDIGGTSVYAREIARGLAARGDHVTIVIRDRDAREFPDLGVDLATIDTKRGWLKPLRLRRARRELLDVLRSKKIDVVYFAYPVTGFGDVFSTLERAGVPYAVGIHGINKSDYASEHARSKRVRKWGLAGASIVTALTKWMAERVHALGVPDERIRLVYYGVDPSLARHDAAAVAREKTRLGLDGKRVLLSLGRLVPRKNFDAVLRAVPALAKRVPDLAYLVVGSGSEEAAWKKLARDLGVDGRVTWVPQCRPDDVGLYYKLCDVFTTVSRTRPEDDTYETFGLVYIEANLCGKSVVAGNEAGVPEAVIEGETGLMVPPDDPRALETALLRLLEDEALRRRMGEAGERRAREVFTWARAARDAHAALEEAARSAKH